MRTLTGRGGEGRPQAKGAGRKWEGACMTRAKLFGRILHSQPRFTAATTVISENSYDLSIHSSTAFGKEIAQPPFITGQCCRFMLFGHLRPGERSAPLPRALSEDQLEAAAAEGSATEFCESQAEHDATALESSGSPCACNLKFKVFTLVYKTNPLWLGHNLPSH